jgi:hypothetical protein
MIKRRKFLISAISVTLLPWLARSSLATHPLQASHATASEEAERHLLSLFSDLQAPRAVGNRYLALYPAEADRELLRVGVIESAGTPDLKGLRASLAHRCREDFRNGDTVIVDGWVLARTEARTCALTTLI